MTTDSEIDTSDDTNGATAHTEKVKRPKANPVFAAFGKANLFKLDPMDVRIYGGLHLPENQRGPNDTAHRYGEHPLVTIDLLEPLDETFVESVRLRGTNTAISIASIDAMAAVANGRTTTRAARLVNHERAAAGLPLIKISATAQPGSLNDHLIMSILANFQRKGWTPLDQFMAAMQLIGAGVDDAEAATYVRLKPDQLATLIAIQGATEEVKNAVNTRLISISAGKFCIAQTDPEKQREALAACLANGGTARAALAAVRESKGRGKAPVNMKRAAMEEMLGRVTPSADADHANTASAYSKDPFLAGVQLALELVMGLTVVHPRVHEVTGMTSEPEGDEGDK